MSLKRFRTTRYLPKYVTMFTDVRGKQRLRFRRKDYPSQYFTAPFGTEAFAQEYLRFNSTEAANQLLEERKRARFAPGSIGDLLTQYYAVPDRLGPSPVTQDKVRRILDRFADGRENRLVRGVGFQHIDAIIAKARMKRIDDSGRQVGGPEAARKLRKELRRLFAFAVKLGWINSNPVESSETIRLTPSERSPGFYTWTEDDIAAYRAYWPVGTKQRLAMELMLWTDQRKIDAIHLGRHSLEGDKLIIRQSKTGKKLILPIVDQLREALDAMPASDTEYFLVTEWGKPFSVKGFGGWFRRQCDKAGLPQCTAHGLRKATMRRMAELEMPNKTMKSVSGHSKDDEVARYTASANQAALADSGLKQLSRWEMSNVSKN